MKTAYANRFLYSRLPITTCMMEILIPITPYSIFSRTDKFSSQQNIGQGLDLVPSKSFDLLRTRLMTRLLTDSTCCRYGCLDVCELIYFQRSVRSLLPKLKSPVFLLFFWKEWVPFLWNWKKSCLKTFLK